MATVRSDGNGGMYLKRTVVEKAIMAGIGALVALLCTICGLAYKELVALHDGQILLNVRIESAILQSMDNKNAIGKVEDKVEAHDAWAREQRQALIEKIAKEREERLQHERDR